MSLPGDDLAFLPEHFTGLVRLFPLPNLVLFPHVIQPLHIFEPRYVELFQEAIEDDRLIAMSMLAQGWEGDYEGRPPIAPVACLARILTYQAQPKSRYNVLMLGVKRVLVEDELPPKKLFREAHARLLEDKYPAASDEQRPKLHASLIRAFEQMLPHINDAEELFNQLSVKTISLGTLTDVIGYAMDLQLQIKQALLAESNVDERARVLLSHLRCAATESCADGVAAGFPPAFSSN